MDKDGIGKARGLGERIVTEPTPCARQWHPLGIRARHDDHRVDVPGAGRNRVDGVEDGEVVGEDRGLPWQLAFEFKDARISRAPMSGQNHLLGGKARAAAMTPERRAEIAKAAAAKRWAKD